jgi:hypothetical protein
MTTYYRVKTNDTPMIIALGLAGCGCAMTELIAQNPQKKRIVNSDGVVTFQGLACGEEIVVPSSWQATTFRGLGRGLAGPSDDLSLAMTKQNDAHVHFGNGNYLEAAQSASEAADAAFEALAGFHLANPNVVMGDGQAKRLEADVNANLVANDPTDSVSAQISIDASQRVIDLATDAQGAPGGPPVDPGNTGGNISADTAASTLANYVMANGCNGTAAYKASVKSFQQAYNRGFYQGKYHGQPGGHALGEDGILGAHTQSALSEVSTAYDNLCSQKPVNPNPPPVPQPQPPSPSPGPITPVISKTGSGSMWPWIIGGTLVAGGAGAAYYLHKHPATRRRLMHG